MEDFRPSPTPPTCDPLSCANAWPGCKEKRDIDHGGEDDDSIQQKKGYTIKPLPLTEAPRREARMEARMEASISSPPRIETAMKEGKSYLLTPLPLTPAPRAEARPFPPSAPRGTEALILGEDAFPIRPLKKAVPLIRITPPDGPAPEDAVLGDEGDPDRLLRTSAEATAKGKNKEVSFGIGTDEEENLQLTRYSTRMFGAVQAEDNTAESTDAEAGHDESDEEICTDPRCRLGSRAHRRAWSWPQVAVWEVKEGRLLPW